MKRVLKQAVRFSQWSFKWIILCQRRFSKLLPLVMVSFVYLCLFSIVNHNQPAVEEETQIQSANAGRSTVWPWCERLKLEYPLVMNYSQIVNKHRIAPARQVPVNIHRFKYLYKSGQMCSSWERVDILSVVKSNVNNWKLRKAIRLTWGREASHGNNKLIFLLGDTLNISTKQKVHYEASNYRDIVQENFIDNYYNNTFKTVMGIHWIEKYCPQSKFVILIDDDVLINFKRMKAYFDTMPAEATYSLFEGNLKAHEGPVRILDATENDKWYMPKEQFPFNCYPPFLSGGAILTSGHVMQMFSKAIPYVKYFKYDDVYISIIAQKLGIRPKHNIDINMVKAVTLAQLKTMLANHGYSNHSHFIETYKKLIV